MRLVAHHATISSDPTTPQTSAEAQVAAVPDASRIEEGIAAVQGLYNIKNDWTFLENAYKNLSLSTPSGKVLLAFWDKEWEAGARRGASTSPPAALESNLATSSSYSPLPAATAYAAAADSTPPDADSREETQHDYDWLAIDPGSETLGFARCYGGKTPRLEIGWVNLAHVDKTTTQFVKGPKTNLKTELGASRLGALRRALPRVFKGSPRRVFLEGYNDRGDKQPGKRSAGGGVKRSRAGAPMSGSVGQGHSVNHEVRGVIKEFASSVPPPPVIVHSWLPVSWKAAGHNGHQGLQIPGGEGASKSAVRDRVEDILGRPLGSDHMRSQEDRKIKLPDDVSDAVAIGLYGCDFYRLQRTYKGATAIQLRSAPTNLMMSKLPYHAWVLHTCCMYVTE